MRNDLTLVCENCALRLPSTERTCPRCARDLRLARDLGERDWMQRSTSGIRPYRDLALFLPVVFSTAFGAWAAVDHFVFDLSFVPVLQMLFVFDLAMIMAGIVWLGWAAIVMAASAIWNGFRAERLRVVPIPQRIVPEPEMPRWTLPKNRGGEPIEWRDLVPGGVLVVIAWAFAIAGFARGHWPGLGTAAAVGFFCTFMIVLGSMLLAWVVWWVRLAARRVRIAFVDIESTGMTDLLAGRGRVEGRARAGERELIAPISGKPCIAFRLSGTMGNLDIDDALVAPMFLETSKATFAMASQRWAVAVPTSARTRVFDEEQLGRLRRFIESRGLRFGGDLALAESIIDDGDRIEAYGVVAMASVPTYRDEMETFEVSDSDGKPVLLVRS